MSRARGIAGIIGVLSLLLAATPAHATFPGENGKIFFSANVFDPETMTAAGIPDVWSANPDGSELVNLTDLPGGPGEGYEPSVSADGSRVAFTTGSQATSEIWVMNADGSNPTRLTFPSADGNNLNDLEHNPAISPNGSKIAYSTTQYTASGSMAYDFDIAVMNSDGSNQQPLVQGTGEAYYPDFAPDGETVVSTLEMTAGHTYGLGAGTLAGAPFTNQTVTEVQDEAIPIQERLPSVSPDGTRVAYTRGVNLGDHDIYTVGMDGSTPTPVAADPAVLEVSPSYSPDGTKIAYNRGTADGEIIIADVGGANQTPLPVDPNVAVFEGSPAWAPKPPVTEVPDATPPDTTIDKAPKKKSTKTKAKFFFSSSEEGSTFECKLDRKPFQTCTSPHKVKKLKPKRYRFEVRAIDAAGNVDPTPAKAKFKVLAKK
jgi:Tol biopolymer transport system component